MPDQVPPLDIEIVRDFVGVAHGDLKEVERMIAASPTLLNATYDWGDGDFETAIGAAGHMGRRDIALFLLGRGARLDLHVAAMLGYLEVMRAALTVYPALLHARGPHGISLLQHAVSGGEEAKSVVEFLHSLS